MKVFVGGCKQAKLDIACCYLGISKDNDSVYDGADMAVEHFYKARVINHFHLFVKNNIDLFETQEKRLVFLNNLMQNNPDIVIIGDEIGSGIVPLEQSDRIYRDSYGRMMCMLSQNAEIVVRIICGICQEIKGP